MPQQFEVKHLTPTIGGEIVGLDLSEPMSDAVFEQVHAAFLDRMVLFFRDQEITLEQHKSFGRRFGELHIHPASRPYEADGESHPEILFLHADENTTRTAGDTWHSDVSCDSEPPMASILRLVKVPPSGGDTLFASMSAAYDALSEPMKRYLGELTATHDGTENLRDRTGRAGTLIKAASAGPRAPRRSRPKASGEELPSGYAAARQAFVGLSGPCPHLSVHTRGSLPPSALA